MAGNILDDFGNDGYPPIDWKEVGIGGIVAGTLISIPSSSVHSDKTGKDAFALGIETSDGPRTLWVGKPSNLGGAIKKAVTEAGANFLQEGATLAVKFDSEEDTGKPQKLRVFKAKYEAPAAAANVDDIFG